MRLQRWRSWRPLPSSCGAAPRPGSAPPVPAGQPLAGSRPPRAATSHGTHPELVAPPAAGSRGATVGARFRFAAMGDPSCRRTSARARRGGPGGSGRPVVTALSGAGQGGGGGSAETASGRAAGLAGLAVASSLRMQSLPRPHGGALGCQARNPRSRQPGSRVGGWLRHSSSESARPGSSMSREKGKCLPQGGA